jgi:two-component system, sensor histidine kinase PdtaS
LHNTINLKISIAIAISLCSSMCTMLHAQNKASIIANIREQILQTKVDTTLGRLYGDLAWEIKHSLPKEASALADKQLQIGYQHHSALLLADAYRMKGIQDEIQKKYVTGIGYYDSSIYYATKAGSNFHLASCFSLLAGMYDEQDDYPKATELYQKGYNYAMLSQNKYIMAILANNLANIYSISNRNEKEIVPLFIQSKNNFVIIKAWPNAALTSSNIALEYIKTKQWQKAKTELQETIMYLQKDTTDEYIGGKICDGISQIYLGLQDIPNAKKYAFLAKRKLEKLNVPDNLLSVLEGLTKIYYTAKQFDTAQQYATMQLQLANEQNSNISKSMAYKTFADIEEQNGNTEKAFAFYKLYKMYNDSVFNDLKEKTIEQAEVKEILAEKEIAEKYKSIQRTNENIRLQSKNKLLQTINLVVIIAVFLALLLATSLYIVYHRKRKYLNQLLSEKKTIERQQKENHILINEVHHRVKNNLTMLKSLLYLQAKSATELETKRILSESQTRIQSMALVHQNLYVGNEQMKLNFPIFIKKLFDDLAITFYQNKSYIDINVEGNCQALEIEQAIPLALIMNELATNSFKYAFVNLEKGKIKVEIQQQDKKLEITYSDNGKGLQQDFNLASGGFGFKVLQILSQQLKANIVYKKTANESQFVISLMIA